MKIKNDIPVLVAIMKDTFDFEILKRYRWYRIPVKSAPKKLKENKYIAFYQTKQFGDEKWKVNYIAKIKEIEIVKRVDLLPEEKSHPRAQNDYYKIKIGRLMKLQNPIPSKKWRLIVFISTTIDKLKKAEEINDLFNESPLEDKLWFNLKKNNINAERQLFVRQDKINYCLDFAITCKKGKIDVECDGDRWHSLDNVRVRDRERNNRLASYGWAVLRFGTKDINEDVDKCIETIRKTINTLLGIKDS